MKTVITGQDYRKKRLELGLSQEQLARKTGVSKRGIQIREQSTKVRPEAVLALEAIEKSRRRFGELS